jgi:DNA polymerase III epsilon subunit-like protein
MIVLDVETTGLDPSKHSVVSIGAVEFDPVKLGFESDNAKVSQPENQFYQECRMWKGAEIMPEALDVHGMSREEITSPDKQSLESLMKSLLSWVEGCDNHTMAGHNVHFDLDFVTDSFRRYDLKNVFQQRVVDTHSLTWMHMVKQGNERPTKDKHSAISSDFVFKYVGINYQRGDHNALEDAKLTAEAISRLLYDEKLLGEYSEHEIPWAG